MRKGPVCDSYKVWYRHIRVPQSPFHLLILHLVALCLCAALFCVIVSLCILLLYCISSCFVMSHLVSNLMSFCSSFCIIVAHHVSFHLAVSLCISFCPVLCILSHLVVFWIVSLHLPLSHFVLLHHMVSHILLHLILSCCVSLHLLASCCLSLSPGVTFREAFCLIVFCFVSDLVSCVSFDLDVFQFDCVLLRLSEFVLFHLGVLCCYVAQYVQ